ncbi:hypothetical protein Dimus_001132, partial [Dionaea muscipula]
MTTVLLFQEAMAVGGPEEGRSKITRTASVSSISSPSLGGYPMVVDDHRQEVADGFGVKGGVELPTVPVCSLLSSPLDHCECSVYGQWAVGAGLAVADGSLVEEYLRAESLIPGVVRPVVAMPTSVPLSPLSCGRGGLGEGGVVSEEARVPQVAREALRSQPTDWLQRLPSSPVVPVSGVDCGVGKDGSGG